MAPRSLKEYDSKNMIKNWFLSKKNQILPIQCLSIDKQSQFEQLKKIYSWVSQNQLVVKVDQLIKGRYKKGLIKINVNYDESIDWIQTVRLQPITVQNKTDFVTDFIIEPYIEHHNSPEYYIGIESIREGQVIYFNESGGVDIEESKEKLKKVIIEIGDVLAYETIKNQLLENLNSIDQSLIGQFIIDLLEFYKDCHFTFIELNPVTIIDNQVHILDLAGKIDETAEFLNETNWGQLTKCRQFGVIDVDEEKKIKELDKKTGASLKFTLINPKGKIWLMIAGGGASVVYTDTVINLGYGNELCNYGEYSGDPDEGLMYEYSKNIFELMTKNYRNDGKILLIGGAIANFTDVAMTFQGIIKAIYQYQDSLKKNQVKIYVRRGGPNYQQGLNMMQICGNDTGLDIQVYGPEVNLTSIVYYALDIKYTDLQLNFKINTIDQTTQPQNDLSNYNIFDKNSVCFIYGRQLKAAQNMLDYDYICQRKPSVACLIDPFKESGYEKFYFGSNEILIPVHNQLINAISNHPDISIAVNFASCRSVYHSVNQILNYNQIKTIIVIAEGVPELQTQILIKKSKSLGVNLIGPATVGGFKSGCFKIGNTGGMIDNIISLNLWKPGSVAYVTKSGGLSNELNNIISKNSDGVYEGLAIGGDRYPGSTFWDHIQRYEKNPEIKIIVLLGEIGGCEEYSICHALKNGLIKKPLIAWCIGTSARLLSNEIQFGHAGSWANNYLETAEAKNQSLKDAGAYVPENFEQLPLMLKSIYQKLVENKIILPVIEPYRPTIPVDYEKIKKTQAIRKPTNIISSICDERGDDVLYNHVPLSQLLNKEANLGQVIGLLWFKKNLPDYFCQFLEFTLILTADHGPAVSGAHNTIVTARAGKDLISSLVSGLLTVGPRFGGAVSEAAQEFVTAFNNQLTAQNFVDEMKKKNKYIMGIGHRIKSIYNPDKRVNILKDFAYKNFPKNKILNYAIEIEEVTTRKNPHLILNVDGCLAACLADLLLFSGVFDIEESQFYLNNDILNGFFALGRSIGLIGHYIDQLRYKQPLYRHPWDDILYIDQ